MNPYVHHVPGRLRIKSSIVKRNDHKASELCKLLSRTDGVLHCEVNAVTGSILIRYDAGLTTAKQLLQLLHEHGHVAEVTSQTTIETASSAGEVVSAATEGVRKTLLNFIVEKAVQRSAAALIGAML